jgi:hypothetical protein
MSLAVDNLSSSAPTRAGQLVGSAESDLAGHHLIFSPGGYSYGSTPVDASVGGTRRKTTLKQAKGTGRKTSESVSTKQDQQKSPNKKSYNELVKEAEENPGAEIRL